MTARLEAALARMDALAASVHEDCEREARALALAPERQSGVHIIGTRRDCTSLVVKVCRCCNASYTESSWAELARVGLMADGEGGALTLRNCTCGSTLALPLVMRVK